MPATGTATLMRSSSAAIHQLYAPPPQRPVTPSFVASTSGRVSQVVERPDAVPGFDAGRRVAAVEPPPHAVAVRAVVDAFDLAELQRVDRQADVAVAGEPGAVMLVAGLVAEADAVLLHAGRGRRRRGSSAAALSRSFGR